MRNSVIAVRTAVTAACHVSDTGGGDGGGRGQGNLSSHPSASHIRGQSIQETGERVVTPRGAKARSSHMILWRPQ